MYDIQKKLRDFPNITWEPCNENSVTEFNEANTIKMLLICIICYNIWKKSIYQEGSWFMNGWWFQKIVFLIEVLQREENTTYYVLLLTLDHLFLQLLEILSEVAQSTHIFHSTKYSLV